MLTLERSTQGWLLSSDDYNKIIRLTSKQVRELFIKLNEEKFDDAYLSRKNPNNLIIVIDNDCFCIKDYANIKNRPYINEIKSKVNKALLRRMVKNVNKKLKGKGIQIVAASLTLTTFISIMAINGMTPQTDILDTPVVSESTNDEFDYALFDEEPSIDDIINEELRNKQNTIKKYIEQYAEIFSIPIDVQQNLYNSNENYLLSSSQIENEVITILADYYFKNMYEQAPMEYNNFDDEAQQLAIMKYASIKGITDKEILTTMLAVHQLETGHGNSDYCRDYNNLGGIFVTNPNTGKIEIKKYPNLDAGAIDFVTVFLRIMNNALTSENYDPTKSIEFNMNPIYCTEKMNPDDPEWYEIVGELKEEIVAEGLVDQLLNQVNNNKALT